MERLETEKSKHVELVENLESKENIEPEEEEDSFFQDIYLLAEQGVPVSDIEKMRTIGINTIKGVQMTTCNKLLELEGFDLKKIKEIQELCEKISESTRFMTALEIHEERKQIFKISTGSLNLDKVLGGGVESMAVTQIFGEAGTGKTQIAHTLCVTTQIPTEGYSGGKVMFIDTENTFRPERIRHVARRFNLEEKKVLENVLCARAYSSEHQYDILKKVAAKFHEEVGMFKLLIIDSIMGLFRMDFSGSRELIKRQQKLSQMMALVRKIAEEYNIAIFITNQIMSNMKYPVFDVNIDSEHKPIGGNILAHTSTVRVALKKIAGNVRIAKLQDSPELEEREEAFIITTGGIKDPKIPEAEQEV